MNRLKEVKRNLLPCPCSALVIHTEDLRFCLTKIPRFVPEAEKKTPWEQVERAEWRKWTETTWPVMGMGRDSIALWDCRPQPPAFGWVLSLTLERKEPVWVPVWKTWASVISFIWFSVCAHTLCVSEWPDVEDHSPRTTCWSPRWRLKKLRFLPRLCQSSWKGGCCISGSWINFILLLRHVDLQALAILLGGFAPRKCFSSI